MKKSINEKDFPRVGSVIIIDIESGEIDTIITKNSEHKDE